MFIGVNSGLEFWCNKWEKWSISCCYQRQTFNNDAPRRPDQPFYCYWCIEALCTLVDWGIACMIWYTFIKYVGLRPLQLWYNLRQLLSPQLLRVRPNPPTLIKPIHHRSTLMCGFIGIIVYYWCLSSYHVITRAIYAIYIRWFVGCGVDISDDLQQHPLVKRSPIHQ